MSKRTPKLQAKCYRCGALPAKIERGKCTLCGFRTLEREAADERAAIAKAKPCE